MTLQGEEFKVCSDIADRARSDSGSASRVFKKHAESDGNKHKTAYRVNLAGNIDVS